MTRRKLPTDRCGKTKAVNIGDTRVYIQTGEYDDDTIGEVFLTIGKHGSELRVYDCLAKIVSIAIQHGVPLELICDKLIGHDFPPNGLTSDSEIPFAKSIVDFTFRWIKEKYIK